MPLQLVTPVYTQVNCGGQTSEVTPPPPVISDAILKPRIVFSNGYESPGQIGRFGRFDSFLTTPGIHTGGWDGHRGGCFYGTVTHHSSGGRRNGGYVTTNKNNLVVGGMGVQQHYGQFQSYNVPTDFGAIAERKYSLFSAFNFFGLVPPYKLSILGFGNHYQDGGGLITFSATSTINIATDYTLSLRSIVSNTSFLDYSDLFQVPSNGWWAIETQINHGVNPISGFGLVKIYRETDPVDGVWALEKIGIHLASSTIDAFAVGSAVNSVVSPYSATDLTNAGMDGLGIDDFIIAAPDGVEKRFFGSIFVGQTIPIGDGDEINSIVTFDSSHISPSTGSEEGFASSHGNTSRFQNLLNNPRSYTEILSGDLLDYGIYSDFSNTWQHGLPLTHTYDAILGPFIPPHTFSSNDENAFNVGVDENTIIRNTLVGEVRDLYKVTTLRSSILQLEGIQPFFRLGDRQITGRTFFLAALGGYGDFFSAVGPHASVIPDDTWDIARRMCRFVFKDTNGLWESPVYTSTLGLRIDSTPGSPPDSVGSEALANKSWSTIAGYYTNPYSFLTEHPITGISFLSISPNNLQGIQLGLRGDLSFYGLIAGPLSPASRWFQADIIEIGVDYVYREEIPVIIEHAPFPPIPDLTTTGINPATRHITVFDASDDWDGFVVTLSVDWGDGTSDPITLLGSKAHTYAAPGIYTIVETVVDNDGLIAASILTPINAFVPATANWSALNPADDTLDFTDASTAHDETISGRHWDFGDGNTSTATNPSHTYAAPGNYTITLVLTTNFSIPGTVAFAQTLAVPFAAGGCTCSAAFMANTAKVQGDDYAGNNSPLPAYANTAAFDTIYEAGGPPAPGRHEYDNWYASINDGIEHKIDTSVLFNGHNTLDMTFGKPAATEYDGAGWQTVVSDDGSPEGNISENKYWARIRIKTDAGVMSDAAPLLGSVFQGLEIITILPDTGIWSYRIRAGHLCLDVNSNTGAGFVNQTFDLGAESQIIGTAGFKDFLVEFDASVGGQVTIKLWIADACSLSGVSPLDSRTIVSTTSNLMKTVNFDGFSFFSANFTASGALKHIHVADWETLPASVSANPFSVAGA